MGFNKPKVIVFGASTAGERFYNKCKSGYEIIAYADNDRQKQGTYFYGYPVLPPNQIKEYDFDYIVIASYAYDEIQRQLSEVLEIPLAKIKHLPKTAYYKNKPYRPFEDEATRELGRNVLLFITDLFTANGIEYFIDHGTLLGIARDGDILPWDDDIDLSVPVHESRRVLECINDNMHKLPLNDQLLWDCYVVYKISERKQRIPVITTLHFENRGECDIRTFKVGIQFIYFAERMAQLFVTSSPEYYFRSRSYIEFMGRRLGTPFNWPSYLEYHYGDWKTPKKDISIHDVKNFRKPSPVQNIPLKDYLELLNEQ